QPAFELAVELEHEVGAECAGLGDRESIVFGARALARVGRRLWREAIGEERTAVGCLRLQDADLRDVVVEPGLGGAACDLDRLTSLPGTRGAATRPHVRADARPLARRRFDLGLDPVAPLLRLVEKRTPGWEHESSYAESLRARERRVPPADEHLGAHRQ